MKPVRHQVGNLPAPKEQRCHKSSDQNRFHKVGQHEQAELHAAVLDEEPNNLRLAFRQVEWDTLGFGDPGNKKENAAQRLNDEAPLWDYTPQQLALGADNFL